MRFAAIAPFNVFETWLCTATSAKVFGRYFLARASIDDNLGCGSHAGQVTRSPLRLAKVRRAPAIRGEKLATRGIRMARSHTASVRSHSFGMWKLLHRACGNSVGALARTVNRLMRAANPVAHRASRLAHPRNRLAQSGFHILAEQARL